MENKIAVIDLGGQYAHMIGRRLRDFGADYELIDDASTLDESDSYNGYILSGGPESVYAEDAPTVPEWLATNDKPVLGICYGHQLLAKLSGIDVAMCEAEFGPAKLNIDSSSPLFFDVPRRDLKVWMSHRDSVVRAENGFKRAASTSRCDVAAYTNDLRKKYGLQFHPEVDHSDYGTKILENFVRRICGVKKRVSVGDQIDFQLTKIREQAAGRKIFFFVSGGVDSMVAFTLCARAIGAENVRAVYVDTGFMRAGETAELVTMFEELGLRDQLTILDESEVFFATLKGVRDPEEKRAKIGKAFIEVQSNQIAQLKKTKWILGQGTIYPDTVESGAQGNNTAKIKTHHNRCDEVLAMIRAGQVIEPISDFYKDEVRVIGRALGLNHKIVGRWPFPGPGLAIRCLCSEHEKFIDKKLHLPIGLPKALAIRFPIRSVGVQGDGRTYRDAVALYGDLNYEQMEEIASQIYNSNDDFNRVIYQLAGKIPERGLFLQPRDLSRRRVRTLQKADRIVRDMMRNGNAYDKVWQFPVIMVPIASQLGSESIILRPVNSRDGMTANFSRLNRGLISQIANEVCRLSGIDSVYLDISDKPPATIEWE